VRAIDLRVGATLLSLTQAYGGGADAEPALQPAAIARLTLEARSGPTYNLHVDGHHGYFAGGVLVHDRP
jgi:hypothetical protein